MTTNSISFATKQVVLLSRRWSPKLAEIVFSSTKQLVLFSWKASFRELEIIFFCNAPILNDLRKCLKTGVFAVTRPVARKNGLVFKPFVVNYTI